MCEVPARQEAKTVAASTCDTVAAAGGGGAGGAAALKRFGAERGADATGEAAADQAVMTGLRGESHTLQVEHCMSKFSYVQTLQAQRCGSRLPQANLHESEAAAAAPATQWRRQLQAHETTHCSNPPLLQQTGQENAPTRARRPA